MVASARSAAIKYSVTPQGFRELMLATREFDKAQATLLRRNIRQAAMLLVTDVRSEVLGGSFKAQTGMRAGIAAGVKVQISTAATHPGVRIVATKGQMPAGKAPMVRAWQRQTFRHPVFGDSAVWVNQSGHPYFDATIEAHRDKVTKAVNDAMTQAAATLAGGHA